MQTVTKASKRVKQVYYLAAGDVLKGRVEPILWMRTCEWLAKYGYDVRLISTYYYRSENVGVKEIFGHFGISPLFRISILPTLLSKRFSGLFWNRLNLMAAFLLRIMPVFLQGKHVIFFSKGQVCMRAVLILENLFRRRMTKIFEIHSVNDDQRILSLLRYMDVIVVNSRIVHDLLVERGVDCSKIETLYNPPFAKHHKMDLLEARSVLGIAKGAKILMYAGKLYDKNVDFFARLSRKLRSIDYELHIVGGNRKILKYAAQLKRNGNLSNLVFHGFQPPSTVGMYLNAATFLFCSYENDFPNIRQSTPGKFADYMQTGRPFLCSTNTAMLEILNDGEHCIYIEPENTDDIVEKLKMYDDKPDLLWRMAQNNEELIKEMNWPERMRHIVKRVEKVLACEDSHKNGPVG